MADESGIENAAPRVVPPPEVRENGSVVYEGMVLGSWDSAEKHLTLNLGWLRLAGVHVRLEADPAVDRKRGGVAFER